MFLFTKIIPIFKHHINIGYGISNEYYGGKNNALASTGEGPKFSSDICRDILCLIIKQLKKEELGIIFKELNGQVKEQYVLVSFTDDTEYITEENQCEE